MVTFVCYGRGDARTFNLYDFVDGNPVYFGQSRTSFAVDYKIDSIAKKTVFLGYDYDYAYVPPFNGSAYRGTTTSATNYVAGKLHAKMSGFSITQERAFEYISWKDPQRVLADVFKGNDKITGSIYDDYLDGWGGSDTFAGGTGNDTYVVDRATDVVSEKAKEGSDTVLTGVSYTLAAKQEIENLKAASAKDTTALKLTGNEFANTITGNAGANTLDGGAGSDTLIGGAGNDTYIVDRATDAVIEKVRGGTDTVVTSASYTLAAKQEIEVLKTVSETAKTPIDLTGNEFANTITGNAGVNVIDGGLGHDILKGGAGRDTFVFDTKMGSANLDHITDFRAVDDTIRLENAIFTALTKTGAIQADEFALIGSKTAVVDPDAHILYEKATGTLFYDANGGSVSGRVAFAVLDNKVALTFQDFEVS